MLCTRGRCSSFLLLAAVLIGAPAVVHAQNGRVVGVVRDSGGVPREGATVRATNSETLIAKSSTTRNDGTYVIADLPPGNYTITASLIGFRRATRANVQVQQTGDVTVDLVVGALPLQAITVTATLREQELADVPFSIAAPTASVLRERGVENIEGIAANVAGFSVQNLGPGQSQVAIRGASAGQIARDQPGVKEQAGVYLDDSPISLSLFTPDLDLFDVSRVEVLRGPQGTLFGSGSLSGTVRYITNQPELGMRNTFGELGTAQVLSGGVGAARQARRERPVRRPGGGPRRAVLQPARRLHGRACSRPGRLDKNVKPGTRTGVRAASASSRTSGSASRRASSTRPCGWMAGTALTRTTSWPTRTRRRVPRSR